MNCRSDEEEQLKVSLGKKHVKCYMTFMFPGKVLRQLEIKRPKASLWKFGHGNRLSVKLVTTVTLLFSEHSGSMISFFRF